MNDPGKKLANLERAYRQLEAFVAEPIRSDRDRAGVIQAFEFTFELFWKFMQDLAQANALQVFGPRQALAAAFGLGLILPDEESQWIAALKDRNLTAHVYNELLANQIVARVVGTYRPLFEATLARIRDLKS